MLFRLHRRGSGLVLGPCFVRARLRHETALLRSRGFASRGQMLVYFLRINFVRRGCLKSNWARSGPAEAAKEGERSGHLLNGKQGSRSFAPLSQRVMEPGARG
jgi:hypothetical protein